MDGRGSFLRHAAALIFAAGVFLPQTVFGQAMGKATLDSPTPSTLIAATDPAPSAAPAGAAPASVHAVAVLPADSKTIIPAPIPPVLPAPPLPTPATLPGTPEVKLPAKPELTSDKAPTDSLPADPSKAATAPPAAPLRPIEHQEIHPRAEAPATQSADAGKSFLPPGTASVLQVVAALAVVIGLIFIGKAAARKFLPAAKAGTGKGVIEILARYPLSKNQSLVLVRIGSQIVTLNQGKDQSHSVLVISDANEVAKILGQIEGTSPKSIQAGFNKLLANARMDLEDPANDPEQAEFEARSMEPENLDTQLEEMAAAKRQLMELRQQVRSVRDSLPR